MTPLLATSGACTGTSMVTTTDASGDTSGDDGTTDADSSSSDGSGVNTSTTTSPDSDASSSGGSTDADPTGGMTSTGDTTGATTGPVAACGNGVLDEGEACDGDVFGEIDSCNELDIGSEAGGEITCADDCTLDISECNICYAPAQNEPCDSESFDRMHALELNCAQLNFNEYDATNSTSIVPGSLSFQAPDVDSWRVLSQLGSYIDPETDKPYWSARGGDKFLMLTTGNLGVPQNGVLLEVPGAAQSDTINDNPDNLVELPGIMKHKMGGYVNDPLDPTPFENCHGGYDCSNTLEAHWKLGTGKGHDAIYFEFEVPVPDGTYGFELDFAFMTAEVPEWIGPNALPYNDIAVIWAASEAYTGNISFIDDGEEGWLPLVTTYLAERDLIELDEARPELKETGFDTVGGSTGWLKARSRVHPGEIVKIAVAVVDRGDQLYDSALLLDNFQWTCDVCVPGTIDDASSCGVTLQ